MKKFEYMVHVAKLRLEEQSEELNKLGQQGWEAYAILPGPTEWKYFFLKREIQEPPIRTRPTIA
ncbi:MAG: hypothetical protein ACYSYL_00015 [Planctomycetota bacterium]|jgi:hypothetical protein